MDGGMGGGGDGGGRGAGMGSVYGGYEEEGTANNGRSKSLRYGEWRWECRVVLRFERWEREMQPLRGDVIVSLHRSQLVTFPRTSIR